MAKIKTVRAAYVYRFFCPGCREWHTFPCNGQKLPNGASWNFNMDMDSPTITPSINIAWGQQADPAWVAPDDTEWRDFSGRCHSVVTAGKIFFCNDSTHELSGQTVELPEVD